MTLKPNRRRSQKRPTEKQCLTGARRRDDAFGEPCRLWQLVAWYISTDPGVPRAVYQVDARWSIYVNRSEHSQPIEPTNKPDGLRCMPGEAVAWHLEDDGRNVASMRITRNAVLAVQAVAFVETLSPVLEYALRERGAATALVRVSKRSAAQ